MSALAVAFQDVSAHPRDVKLVAPLHESGHFTFLNGRTTGCHVDFAVHNALGSQVALNHLANMLPGVAGYVSSFTVEELQGNLFAAADGARESAKATEYRKDGTFMQRYRKYIGSPTRPAADIKQRLAMWKTTWLFTADSTTRALLGSPHSGRAVDLQIERVDDIVDVG